MDLLRRSSVTQELEMMSAGQTGRLDMQKVLEMVLSDMLLCCSSLQHQHARLIAAAADGSRLHG